MPLAGLNKTLAQSSKRMNPRIPPGRCASNGGAGKILGATATTRQVRQQLAARLALARARTDELFGLVRPEAMYDRPIPERHRVAFYVGHLEAFDWNLLGRNVFELSAFHSSFDRLFAFGIDPVGGGLPDDQPA